MSEPDCPTRLQFFFRRLAEFLGSANELEPLEREDLFQGAKANICECETLCEMGVKIARGR